MEKRTVVGTIYRNKTESKNYFTAPATLLGTAIGRFVIIVAQLSSQPIWISSVTS